MKTGIVSGTVLTSGSTQNVTDSQFASDCALALLVPTNVLAVDTLTGNARFGVGAAAIAADGSTLAGQNGVSIYRSDNATGASMVSISELTAAACLYTQGSVSPFFKAAATGGIAQGVALNYSTLSGSAYLYRALLLGGSDIKAAATAFNTSTGTAVYDWTHGMGAAPEVLLFVSHGLAQLDTLTSSALIILGAWTNNGQFGLTSGAVNNVNPSQTYEQLTVNDVGASQFNDASTNYRITVTTVDATKVRLTLSSSANCNGAIGVIAMRGATNPLAAAAGAFLSPAASGSYTLNTGIVGNKQAAIFVPTRMTATPNASGVAGPDTTDTSGSIGIGAAVNRAGTLQQFCAATVTKDGVATSYAKTQLTDSAAILALASDGSIAYKAAITQLDNALVANFSNVAVRGQIGWLAIGPSTVSINSVGAITNGASFTISVNGASASGNAVTINSVAQTITSESSSSITCTAVLGANRYATSYPLVVTDAGGNPSAATQVSIGPAATVEFVNLIAPLVPPDQRLTAVPDLQGGWQLELSNVTGGFTLADVQVYSDGEWIATNGVYTFDVRANDGVNGWGAVGTQSIGTSPPLVTVDPANQTVVQYNPVSFSVSATGSITGYQWFRDGVPISGATNPTYTIASAVLADNGAQFYVQVSNSAGYDQSAAATLSVVATTLPLRNDVWDGSLPGLSINRSRAYLWKTAIQESLSGKESRVRLAQYPRLQFGLQYELLRDNLTQSELKAIVGLFNAASGAYDSFLYLDPTFNHVDYQQFGTGDGTATAFQIVAIFQNSGSVGGPEIIQNFNGTPTLFFDTSLVSASLYTLGPTGIVTFTTAPSLGVPLRWTGDFFYRVRFSEDTLEMTQFLDQWWQSKQIVLKSIKL